MTYTQKQLQREAVLAVRSEAKSAGVRARCLGYELHLANEHHPCLVALGERSDGYKFTVNVAI